jgi:hypothetical protein
MGQRLTIYRTAVRTDVSAATTYSIADNVIPPSLPGAGLIYVGYRLRGATVDVADMSRVRLTAGGTKFYDQTTLHERQFSERFQYGRCGPLTTAGGTATTLIGVGGYGVFLNDQRASGPDAQDSMCAPFGAIAHELVFAAAPAAGTAVIDVTAVYSNVPASRACRRLSMVLNIAAASNGATRLIDDPGAMLAYGIPHPSLTLANAISRFKMNLGGRVIFDGDMGTAQMTELSDSPLAFADSIQVAGAGAVIWKGTAGNEFVPAGGRGFVEVDAGASCDLTTVELPYWSFTPQGA